MRAKLLPLMVAAILTGTAGSTAIADDGAIVNKTMSRTINDVVEEYEGQTVPGVPEAEHAFADYMKFYVPSQAASGLVGPIAYCDIDNEPESGEDCVNYVEELEVAKPLINVFIYGGIVETPYDAFHHSFMDAYAAVSLDDGETWKKTNLSESADLSSFNLDTDHESGGNTGGEAGHDHDTGNTADRASQKEGNNGGQATAGDGGGVSNRASQKVGNSGGQATAGGGVGKRAALLPKGEEDGDGCGPQDGTGEGIPVEDGSGEGACEGGINLAGVSGGSTRGNGVSRGSRVPGQGGGNGGGNGFGGEGNGEGNGEGPNGDNANGDGTGEGGGQFGGPADDDEDSGDGDHEAFDLTVYPGGVSNVFRAVAGNKVLVAWPSRYCSSGQPAYTMTTDNADEDQLARLDAITDLIREGDTDLGVTGLSGFTSPIDGDAVDDLYLVDAFGVAGAQGSQDFADEGYPDAGVVPYRCVWTARGILLPGDDPRTADNVEESHMVWTKAERLTSGRRDPNRIEVSAVQGAGFVVTWQEDPEGLRPGQGEGPGEGWSGAVAHPQTDVWYSFINEEYFDIVETVDNTTVPIDILDHDLLLSGRPQVFVPMAVPMRLTNNAKCNPPDTDTAGTGAEDLYCVYEATDEVPVGAIAFGLKDQCADTVTIQTGNENGGGLTDSDICVADTDGDGLADLPNRANTAATRPRLSTQAYESELAITDKSAWVVVVAEESKGLGKYFFEPATVVDGYAIPCEEGSSLTCTEEIGKNVWYFSFDMGTPDTSEGAGLPNSLVENLVSQGNMLNQAEVNWETGELVGLMSTEDMEDYGDYNFDIVNTEIARRGSLLVQGIAKADGSASKILATPAWKQGPMRQGGPADVMLRRMVYEECVETSSPVLSSRAKEGRVEVCHVLGNGDTEGACDDADACIIPQTIDVNPYSFEYMVCENFLIEPDVNPYYPGGVCADPATNLSGVVPDTCLDDETGGDVPCPTVDFTSSTYGIGDTNPILQGVVQGEGNTQRVLTWHQCPSDGAQIAGDITAVTCDTDDRTDDFVNLLDQSWYNPLDVAKGHRGFLDGDFVMFLYGWSPNWRLNAKGSDRYDLYVRRSFDGGETWTTLPENFTSSVTDDQGALTTYSGDGTVTCESYRTSETGVGGGSDDPLDEPKVCYDFAAGAAEHARNVTQHKSMNITTLDPRFANTGSPRGVGIDPDTCTDGLFVDDTVIEDIFTCDDLSEDNDTDLRNPSRYFMVFETGDNNTVSEGEAEPLDLLYSRAESFGDDYVVWTETDTDSADATLCYPSDPHGVEVSAVIEESGFCNEFDRLNTRGDTHSSEASLAGNSAGTKMYAVWAQWAFEDDDYEGEITESDAMARRVWWIDDYVSDTEAYTLPGTQQDDTQ